MYFLFFLFSPYSSTVPCVSIFYIQYLYFHSVHLSRFPLKSPSSKSPSTLELLYSIAQWTPRSCWIPLFQASQSRSNSVNLLVLKNINRNCSTFTSLQKNANKCKFKVEMTIFFKLSFCDNCNSLQLHVRLFNFHSKYWYSYILLHMIFYKFILCSITRIRIWPFLSDSRSRFWSIIPKTYVDTFEHFWAFLNS